MKILVTGANGYLGINLIVALLQKGYEVLALTKSPINFSHENLTVALGDVINIQKIFKGVTVNVIFHTAARVNFEDGDQAITRLTRDNIIATEELANFALKNGIGKVIYSSSCSVYEENYNPDYWITEEHKLRPRNIYATSKLVAEWLLADKLSVSTTELVVLRYSSIYGCGQKPGTILPILIQNAANHSDINIYGSGNRIQDYVYIDDVVNANLLCMHINIPFNTRLNIGSGQGTSDLELAHKIKEIWKSTSVIKVLNNLMHPEDYFNYKVEKAKQLLGYQPVGLTEGLRLYKESYSSHESVLYK
jgi:UDP-glucose 4-epimerase